MAVISLSLRPSLLPPTTSSSSSSSSYCGGINLRTHKNFIAINSSSPFASSTVYTKGSSSRFGIVFAASGDYYATLGIPKSATNKEIKAAYRKLARQVCMFHFEFGVFYWFRELVVADVLRKTSCRTFPQFENGFVWPLNFSMRIGMIY